MNDLTATYSPEDNKLRLYSLYRLPKDLYERVRAAGFSWAPKQGLFVAPAWNPEREDLLIELCGEIGDEDTSLVDRAEVRADRFEGYSDNRAADAESAKAAVDRITSGIPAGQPILVGHHSQRHAEKHAKQIENGMRKAVNMWATSKYWTSRAAGALRHAKYKERPDVRARRIKGIETDRRRELRRKAEAETGLKLWSKEGLTEKQALFIAGNTPFGFPVVRRDDGGYWWSAYDVLRPPEDRYRSTPDMTLQQVLEAAQGHFPRIIATCDRWIAHCDNRLAYEKAMLEEQGASELLEKQPRPKQLPICNYRAPDGIKVGRTLYSEPEIYAQTDMTSAEYAEIDNNYKGTRVVDNSHRVRIAIVRSKLSCIFLTNSKVHERPAAIDPQPRELPAPRIVEQWKAPERTAFDDMREQLKHGVQVVAAPQLFPTPKALARRMVGMLGAAGASGKRVLEPSAGTGVLLRAAIDSATGADNCRTVAVEINPQLARALEEQRNRMLYANDRNHQVVCGDFLKCNGDLGKFDAVIMNPPFANAQDIVHIKHALTFLKPGGRLVAICVGGSRQAAELQPLVEQHGGTWERLPPDTFKEQGTSVNTVLLSLQV